AMIARVALTSLLLAAVGIVRTAAQDAPPARDSADFTKALITTDPAAGPAPSQESITAIENAVLATHDKVVAAIESLEFGTLAAMTISTDRGALIADGRVTLSRDDMIETIRREFAPLDGVHHTFSRRHVAVLSPTTALIVAEGTVDARTHDGGAFSRRFTQTWVFMKVDDAWKLAHLHSSTPPATLGGR
ncbi:MAG: nuclear transport factor 2 family protein, partial [Opitutaceae bacterium]|nr:nuclear transport factor 2 family protein [Opitutaceae bacterium]